ncbi:MAG: LytTR family transcriptional regulator [Lunatimonas sp.]|nr:LytTR family transcriptional regulator [Lunatimonas sp.]
MPASNSYFLNFRFMYQISKFLSLPFDLLQNTREKVLLIGACAAFTILFINLYTPFNIDQWEPDQGFSQFLRLSGFGVIGGVFLAFSQLLIQPLLVKGNTRIIHFVYWVLCEVTLLALLFHVLYGSGDSGFLREYIISFKYTFLGLLIPYTLALCFIWIFRKQEEEQNEPKSPVFSSSLIHFKDEYGNNRLALKLSSILFIEAADNYSTIHYADNGTVKKEILRNSLKGLSEQLRDLPIKRCHRSYLVNMQNVKMVKKTSGKVSLILECTTAVVPVSRKFIPEFGQLFS